MLRLLCAVFTVFPALAFAETFERPIPQAQSATAEWLFLGASLALVASLVAVHVLVKRR
ncbi:protein NnrT [Marivita sp. S2033]|uniref:protein NnrT n=1 Tax=Marivita sp. S2033 TaxID=3373187 RepID=UPI003981B9D0